MAEMQAKVPFSFRLIAATLSHIVVACGLAFAQQSARQPDSKTPLSDQWARTNLDGCLLVVAGRPGIFNFEDRETYKLSGNTAELEQIDYKEVIVEGREDASLRPIHAFRVDRVVQVVETPRAHQDAAFGDPSAWQTVRIEKYGIQFSHPSMVSVSFSADSKYSRPDFRKNQSVVPLASLGIPGELYAGSNFGGGVAFIFVQPEIKTRRSCEEFERDENASRAGYTAGGIHYSATFELGAGLSHQYSYYHFHTFEDGVCYELEFVFIQFSVHVVAGGCTIAPVEKTDYQEVIDALMAQVAYFPPRGPARKAKPQS